ncbi:MAG: tryptophan synthase subunit alpha [Spirochaetaceae bacterium]|nr:tryptophan synthase subunit alpha [Spirochaetaceae bacterium]
MKHKASLMAHCVAYFPDARRSMAAARGLARGGTDYLEVQFPFSDPTADGPAIQTACRAALESGFSVDRGFEWIRRLSLELVTELAAELNKTVHPTKPTGAGPAPIFIMSYANLLVRRGIERFCREAAEAGAAGLIVPDLLPPEDEGLYAACRKAGLEPIPVVSPGISERRLAAITGGHAGPRPKYLYTTLRSGITGGRTEVGAGQIAHLQRCRAAGAHVMAGFGIESPEQVDALAPHTDTLVAGSYFVKQLIELGSGADPEHVERRLRLGVKSLSGL